MGDHSWEDIKRLIIMTLRYLDATLTNGCIDIFLYFNNESFLDHFETIMIKNSFSTQIAKYYILASQEKNINLKRMAVKFGEIGSHYYNVEDYTELMKLLIHLIDNDCVDKIENCLINNHRIHHLIELTKEFNSFNKKRIFKKLADLSGDDYRVENHFKMFVTSFPELKKYLVLL